MFLIFTCDNLMYSIAEMVPEFWVFYQDVVMATPFPNNIITMAMVFSFRMIVAHEFDVYPSKRETAVQVLFLVALMVATSFAGNLWGRMSFHLILQVCMLGILIFAFKGLGRRKSEMGPGGHRQWLLILIMSAATHLVGAVERFVFLLSGGAPGGSRIIGFEVFGVLCSAFALSYLFRRLGKAHKPYSDDDIMQLFISHYQLTPREAELMPLLLGGAQNSQICEEKFISLNTVKVHTHNIYRKLGIERRSQLSAKLSEFSANHRIK